MPLNAMLLLIGLVTLVAIAAVVLPPFFRWRRDIQHPREEGRQCKCGYRLVGLVIPRCPECGRMIGFDKSPAELGVTEEQMHAEAERRRITRGSPNIP